MSELQKDIPQFPNSYAETNMLLNGEIELTQYIPEQPSSQVPILIAPGWGETKKVFRELGEKLCRAGRIVITFSHPRTNRDTETTNDYDNQELRKAATIITIFKELGLSKVDIVAHSEGGINSLLAAKYAQPERVRSIILCNPAGLIGDDTVLDLLVRFAKKNVHNIDEAMQDVEIRKRVIRGLREGGKYISQNPRLALEEVRKIADTRTESLLLELHQRGIGIVVVHTFDDDGFPPDRIQKNLVSADLAEGFVDGVLSLEGGHDAMTLQPDQFVTAIISTLNAFESEQ